MDRLKQIRSLSDLKEFLMLNKLFIKKAALPVTVVVALLLFWVFGGDNDKAVKEDSEAVPDIAIEETENPEGDDAYQGGDIYVDISGCVMKPGVYKVDEGTRLFQLIEKAGGLTENADTRDINRAEEVYDGQKVIIYSADEDQDEGLSRESSESEKININKADSSELQEVPGIGPATAQKIIEYRQSNGRFKALEDLKNVSGIGEKTFQNMKEYITV